MLDLHQYYDDALTNAIWWFDHGEFLVDEFTPANMLYVYDCIILGNQGDFRTGTVVPVILDVNNAPMLYWITDRDIILVDPRMDKQRDWNTEKVLQALEAFRGARGLVPISLDKYTATLHACQLRISTEVYTPTLVHLTFPPRITENLSRWKEEFRAELVSRPPHPRDRDRPLEPPTLA